MLVRVPKNAKAGDVVEFEVTAWAHEQSEEPASTPPFRVGSPRPPPA